MSLAVVLLVVLALASIIGTILLQNQQQTDYMQQFGVLWYWVFRSLGLFDMYHTWWFQGLLAFLMLSLVFCLWHNAPRMLREVRSRKVFITDKSLQRFHHLHHWYLRNTSKEEALTLIKKRLKDWEQKSSLEDDRVYLRADKGRLHKLGYIFVHSAILIILIGGWSGVQFGFRGNMSVPEGGNESKINFLKGTDIETLAMDFKVRCNDFYISFYPTGQPKEFRSNLTIIEDGKEVLTSDIIVNEPLLYKGTRIYQSSFGDAGSDVKLKLFYMDGSSKTEEVKASVYQTYKDSSTGISYEFTDFKPFNVENMADPGEPKEFQDLGPAVEFIMRGPDMETVKIKSFMNPFMRDGENLGSLLLVSFTSDARDYQPVSLGLDFTNPKEWALFHAFARHLEKNTGNDEKKNFEAFKAALKDVFGDTRPEGLQTMGSHIIQSMSILAKIPWVAIPVLDDYEQHYYTGLQLTRDPGMNIVWIGSAILCFGLCIMFYMPHRKIWCVLQPQGDGVRLSVAGNTNRNTLGFEQEFEQLIASISSNIRIKENV
ncbi:MAG: cytochrome c biogenesis protein ResB [Mariprofundaceae bacterium]|nr:cytochrome c biogenesis protein ResB [Mariprofundaceae bacterium]